MKSLIYKYLVLSGIILNLSAMCLVIYAIKSRIFLLMMLTFPAAGILNRKILDNGFNINKKKKIIIVISFLIVTSVILIYSEYHYNMLNKQLDNM